MTEEDVTWQNRWPRMAWSNRVTYGLSLPAVCTGMEQM